jgi:hypothetical protein
MRRVLPQFAVITFIMLVIVTVISAQSSTDEPRNEIEIRGIYSLPSGDTSFSATGSTGSTISFDRDFDFRSKLGFEMRYTHRTASGKHKFLAEYSNTNWNRTKTLSRSFTFRGETYQANFDATADLKLRTYRAMYSYRWGTEKLRIGPMVDMGVIDTQIKISGTTNSGARTAEGSIAKFAATVGYDLDYKPISQVSFFNNMGGIVFFGDRLFHVEGGVKYFPARHFGISGGYKFQYFKTIEDENFFKVKQHGPFFGGIIRF